MKVVSGSTRMVFVFKSNVIKIPNIRNYKLFLNGILSNLQENEFSKIGRVDLAKVKYCDFLGIILVMDKACRVNIPLNLLKKTLEKKYKYDYMKEFMLSDFKLSNWGVVGTELVKVDYGS